MAKPPATIVVPQLEKRQVEYVPTAWHEWFARGAYGVVFAWNMVCAVQFIAEPGAYAGAYQLSGVQGEAALRGLGVAFLMWNATYPLFIYKPSQHVSLGAIILVQQVIGLVGELAIQATLPANLILLQASIARFVIFDAAGLLLMAITFTYLQIRKSKSE